MAYNVGVSTGVESSDLPLRERKRITAMRRVQEVAVAAFTGRGFDPVTIEQIAAEAEVAPVSVYRWFGTKEGIVLWDEYDPPLFETIAANLIEHPPLTAIRLALLAELDRIYDTDRALVLARSKLIFATPPVMAASLMQTRLMADGLATLFDGAEPEVDPYHHRVLATAIVAALTEAIAEWTRLDGEPLLSNLIDRAFIVLGHEREGTEQ